MSKTFLFQAILFSQTVLIQTIQYRFCLHAVKCQDISRGYPRDEMVKAMDCGIVVSEFVLKSRYDVHFRANTLGKGINPYPASYGLNSATAVFQGEWLWH